MREKHLRDGNVGVHDCTVQRRMHVVTAKIDLQTYFLNSLVVREVKVVVATTHVDAGHSEQEADAFVVVVLCCPVQRRSPLHYNGSNSVRRTTPPPRLPGLHRSRGFSPFE